MSFSNATHPNDDQALERAARASVHVSDTLAGTHPDLAFRALDTAEQIVRDRIARLDRALSVLRLEQLQALLGETVA